MVKLVAIYKRVKWYNKYVLHNSRCKYHEVLRSLFNIFFNIINFIYD